MQYELYIDVFFVVNFLMDFLILQIMKRVLKSNAAEEKILLGALAGAFSTSLLICISLAGWIKLVILHLGISTWMIKIVFGFQKKDILKKWSILYIVSVLVGGVLTSIRQYVGKSFEVFGLFLSAVICSYSLVMKIMEFLERYWKVSGGKCQVRLYLNGKSCKVSAIKDTGNMLYDSITGKPVHIISNNAIKKFTNEKVVLMRYISYHTVQGDSEVMPLIKIDKMCICGEEEQEIKEPLLGISACAEFGDGDYDMILHPKDLREG